MPGRAEKLKLNVHPFRTVEPEKRPEERTSSPTAAGCFSFLVSSFAELLDDGITEVFMRLNVKGILRW